MCFSRGLASWQDPAGCGREPPNSVVLSSVAQDGLRLAEQPPGKLVGKPLPPSKLAGPRISAYVWNARMGGEAALPIAPLLVAALFGLLDGALLALRGHAPTGVVVWAAVYALGYELILGVILWISGLLLARAARQRFGGSITAALLSLLLGALILPDELRVRAEKLAPSGGVSAVVIFGVVSLSALPAMAAVAGRRLGSARWSVLGLLAALLAQLGNHFVFRGHYPGIHLFVTVLAAVLASSALWDALRTSTRLAGMPGVVIAALALGAATSVPSPRVRLELLRHSGVGLAPYVTQLHAAGRRAPTLERPEASSAIPRRKTEPGLGRKDFIVVLLSVDAMRGDILEADRELLPDFAALADGSVRFRNARSAANATVVALTSLFTSRYYSQLRWEPLEIGGVPFPHKDTSPRFPELLARAGIPTILIENADWMAPKLGICLGFRERVDTQREADSYAYADETARAVRERLSLVAEGPAFLFAHFVDAHAPYDRGGTQGPPRARYVRELRNVGRAIQAVVQHIGASSLNERALVIITADHGEAFGEHGDTTHGATVYEEAVRVPLWVRAPGLSARDVEVPVSLVDLAPTIVDLLGQDIAPTFLGETLVPLLLGEASFPKRSIVLDTGRRKQAMVFPNNLKVIRDLRFDLVELYDLSTDPGERNSLYDDATSVMPELDTLAGFFDRHTLREGGYTPPFRNP